MKPPVRLSTWFIRRFADLERQEQRKRAWRARREKSGGPRRVEYYHEVANPHASLTAQVIERLAASYEIELVPRLVGGADSRIIALQMNPELYEPYTRKDAADIAEHFGLSFDDPGSPPDPALVALGNQMLAGMRQQPQAMLAHCKLVNQLVWSGDTAGLQALIRERGLASTGETREIIEDDEAERLKLGYVYGGTFHYEGEWYPGVDRLDYLEQRLISEGARRSPGEAAVVPRPEIRNLAPADGHSVTLEFFFSVRSPYSHLSWQRVMDLVARTGVRLQMRPVRPIVMRAPQVVAGSRPEQGRYIFLDAAREARRYGVPFRRFFDPIYRGTENAYAMYAWAEEQGKGAELLYSATCAAFDEGQDMRRTSVLRRVVERVGLDWGQAQRELRRGHWQTPILDNERKMADAGQWGVPSFRVSGGSLDKPFCTWGADRIWLVEADIARRANGSGVPERAGE